MHTLCYKSLLPLLILIQLVIGDIVFHDAKNTVSVSAPTLGYFQQQPLDPFQGTNCLLLQVMPSFPNTDCTFAPATPPPNFDPTSTVQTNYTCTVALVGLMQGQRAGCNNVYQLVDSFQKTLIPTLKDVQLPDANVALLVILPRVVPGLLGGPISTPYLSHSISLPDGQPPMDVNFISFEDSVLYMSKFRMASEVLVDLSYNAGPWNDFFLSTGYIAYRWVFFGLNCLMIAYGLYRLFLAATQGTLKADQRTIIFLGGLISAMMFGVALTLKRQTQLYFILEQVSSFFFALAFYLLLLLWSGILSQVQKTAFYSPLRLAIYFAMLAATVNFAFGVFWLTNQVTATMAKVQNVFRFIIPSSQAIVACLFLFYAIRFQLRRTDYNASRDTRRALTKLSWLAVLGFFTFIVKAVTNFAGGDNSVAGSIPAVAAVFVAADVAALGRAFGILLILGVRLPETKMSSLSSSVGSKTFMSWGGWSRGWRRALWVGRASRGSDASTMTATSEAGLTTSGLVSTNDYTKSSKFGKSNKSTDDVDEEESMYSAVEYEKKNNHY
jgi:hypothetical protein